MKKLFCTILFILASSLSAHATIADHVTQWGITWTFDTMYTIGQFVNGDYMVLDPGTGVKIINIDPGYVSSPRAMNGSMINPRTATQGYDGYVDSLGTHTYDAAYNVGIGISSETPLVLHGDQSLVSTITWSDVGVNHTNFMHNAAVLTSVSTMHDATTFRPGISTTTKVFHTTSELHREILASKYYWTSKPSIATKASMLSMAWIDHSGDWPARYMHPDGSGMDNYYYPTTWADSAVMLNMDYTLQEKEPLLINFVQVGLDLYSIIASGSIGWLPNGGHSSGRKFMILFAAALLNDADMLAIFPKTGDYLNSPGYGPGYDGEHITNHWPPDYISFGEDGQTFYVSQSDVDATHSAWWVPNNSGHTPRQYTTDMIGCPEWGQFYARNQYTVDASWRASYRMAYTNIFSYVGFDIATRLMGLKTVWNHQAFFDYNDRYMAVSAGNPDPFGCVYPDQTIQDRPGGVGAIMWDKYRGDYPAAGNQAPAEIPMGSVILGN